MLRILFPYPYAIEVSRLRQQLDEAHFAWSKEWKRQQPDFKIENVRFTHDPYWNKRILVCKRPTMAKRGSGTPRMSSCAAVHCRSRECDRACYIPLTTNYRREAP